MRAVVGRPGERGELGLEARRPQTSGEILGRGSVRHHGDVDGPAPVAESRPRSIRV